MLDDLTDVNALISVTVWEHVGSWAGEAVEHRKMAKDALAGRADSAADRLRRHIEVFQRRVVEALGTPEVTAPHADQRYARRETGAGMNFQQQQESLSGVVAVPTTPFGPDGGIDEPGYQRVVRRLVEGGITTVTPNGNTGEFYALAPAEAKVVTRLGLEAADPRHDGHGRRRSRCRLRPRRRHVTHRRRARR